VTAAGDRRDELEAELWRLPGFTAVGVDRVLARADAYAKAEARASGEPRPAPAGRKPPAAHFAGAAGRPACQPHETGSSGWQVTGDPQAVTCEHCRKRPEWREAVAPPPVAALAPASMAPAPRDDRMAITPDGDIRRVCEFAPGDKWWCDGEDCDDDCLRFPHVHPLWGPALRVDLLTGNDERHPAYVQRDGDAR
jgi:hypothetical protein